MPEWSGPAALADARGEQDLRNCRDGGRNRLVFFHLRGRVSRLTGQTLVPRRARKGTVMLQCVSCLRAALGCAMILAAYGCSDESANETAVSRNFEALARSVAACASDYRSCIHAGTGAGVLQACTAGFRDCRVRAGTDAENGLAVAIASCEDRSDACIEKSGASDEPLNGPCAQSLRACMGQASARRLDDSNRDYTKPNPYASTYSCFGQLQECVAAAGSPTQCAASARTCVIDSVGDPPSRGTTARPIDGGVREPQAGSAAGASGPTSSQSMAGAAGSAIPAGRPARP
jgi:hypothetical protein